MFVVLDAPKPPVLVLPADGCDALLPKSEVPGGLAPNRPPPALFVVVDAPKPPAAPAAGAPKPVPVPVPVLVLLLPNEKAGLFACACVLLFAPKPPNVGAVDGCELLLPKSPPGLGALLLLAPNEKPVPPLPNVEPVDGGCAGCVVEAPKLKPVDGGCAGCVVDEPKPPNSGLDWLFCVALLLLAPKLKPVLGVLALFAPKLKPLDGAVCAPVEPLPNSEPEPVPPALF